MDLAQAMDVALEEAAVALQHGDVPVGAVVVLEGAIVAAAHNERERRADPTAHAEVLALRSASAALGGRLEPCELVVTLEPCVMCAGACRSAGIARLVFGAFDARAGASGSRYHLLGDPRLGPPIRVVSGVRAEAAQALLLDFFRVRRPGRIT